MERMLKQDLSHSDLGIMELPAWFLKGVIANTKILQLLIFRIIFHGNTNNEIVSALVCQLIVLYNISCDKLDLSFRW